MEDLTVEEAAQLFKVSADTVRRWVRSGKIGHYRLGAREIRFRPEHIEAFKAAGEQPAAVAQGVEVSGG